MDIRYNFMFYNHIFPHLTMLIDFLVNDAAYRSDGKISFPGVYAPGYAYLSSKVYGSLAGSVYGHKNVRLWLPQKAINISDVALNYLCGTSDNDVYLVLLNTSKRKKDFNIQLKQQPFNWVENKRYSMEVIGRGGDIGSTTMVNGHISITVNPGGITTCRVLGLMPNVPYPFFTTSERKQENVKSFFRDTTMARLGILTGMLINTSPHFSDAYLFSNLTEKDCTQVSLAYRLNTGDWHTITDKSYPFEFDIHLDDPSSVLSLKFTVTNRMQQQITSKTYSLSNR
ncbi:MAG: hypothetical protein NVSMB24_28830 [Mucilaginibacter sp.]